MKIASAAKAVGVVLKIATQFAYLVEREDINKQKEIAKQMLKPALNIIFTHLLKEYPIMREFLSKAFRWDFILDTFLHWAFIHINPELKNLSPLLARLREYVEDILVEYAIESAIRAAAEIIIQSTGVKWAVWDVGQDKYILFFVTPKEKWLIFQFRF